jgi:hypothetical protein
LDNGFQVRGKQRGMRPPLGVQMGKGCYGRQVTLILSVAKISSRRSWLGRGKDRTGWSLDRFKAFEGLAKIMSETDS